MSGVRLDLHASDLKLAPGILRQSMRALEHAHNIPFGYSILKDIADQIEAQTKPPRIPEPGLWGVVEAKAPDSGRLRLEFIRVDGSYPQRWQPVCMNYSFPLTWDDLIDPTLIREGVQP